MSRADVARRGIAGALAATLALLSNGCGGAGSAGSASGGSSSGDAASSCAAASTSTEPTWISIPAGTFTMGCTSGDAGCAAHEEPAHAASVPAFSITQTEITQAQYAARMGENPSLVSECDSCPVDHVPWDDASAYCAAIGGRLPSEAEWERTARAGAATIYSCGSDASCLADAAWYSANAGGTTRAVGGKDPNAYCLYDMAGNVWEWVEDPWHATYDGAPADGTAWKTGCTTESGVDDPACAAENRHVVRGGSFALGASALRVSARSYELSSGSYFIKTQGFRCARDAE